MRSFIVREMNAECGRLSSDQPLTSHVFVLRLKIAFPRNGRPTPKSSISMQVQPSDKSRADMNFARTRTNPGRNLSIFGEQFISLPVLAVWLRSSWKQRRRTQHG